MMTKMTDDSTVHRTTQNMTNGMESTNGSTLFANGRNPSIPMKGMAVRKYKRFIAYFTIHTEVAQGFPVWKTHMMLS